MPFIVTGISQSGDTSALEAALKAAGLSLESFESLVPEDAATAATAGGAGLVDTNLLTGGLETGTGVPGLSGSTAGLGGGSRPAMSPLGDSLWDKLADLAIPDDEVENYAEALELGRTIVAYHGDSKTVGKIEQIFRDSALVKVKTF